MQEVTRLAEISDATEGNVTVSEDLTDENAQLSHESLGGRYLQNQHIITSITGLREELDGLEALQNIESKNRGVAQYYEWADSNPSAEDRTGCFVSLVSGTDTIKICTSKDENVFGVIVPASTTGLIGGKYGTIIEREITAEDTQYGLVCNSGKVLVRSESSVSVGDCVVPNVLGMARKSAVENPIKKSHFQTIDITDVTVYCLSYTPIDEPEVHIVNEDGSMGDRVGVATEAVDKTIAIDGAKITVVIGDTGYSEGDKLCFMYNYESNGDVGYKVIAVSYVNGVHYAAIDLSASSSPLIRLQDEVNDLHTRIAVVEENVVVAINKANEACDRVENATGGGSGTGSSDGSEGDSSSGDGSGSGGNVVIDSELEARITELETKADDLTTAMNTAQAQIGANKTNIEQNDELIQTLANTVHPYAVGQYSQAYGLTNEQAASMLSSDPATVYVPYVVDVDTTTVAEEYYVEGASNVTKTFTEGYSYKWLGTEWDAGVQNVYIINEYVAGADGYYWLVAGSEDVTNDEVIYKAGTLYLFTDGAWTPVARLEDNALARVGSMITQTADSIKASVVNQDAFATLQIQVNQNTTDISLLSGTDGDYGTSLAGVQIQANKNSASVLQLSEYGDNVVSYSELTIEPTGTFYATRPTWSWSENKWVFSGNTNSTVGFVDDVNYCYAQNTDKTFFYYTCEADNRWTRTEIGQSTAMAAIYQQSNEQGAMINLVVTDGKINSADIILAASEDGSSMDLIADSIGLSGYVTFTDLSTSGKTTIHGGSITTGTIQAGSIAAGAITADKIDSGAITADKLAAGAITADKIDSGAITADKLAAGAITAASIDAEVITSDAIDVIAAKVQSATIDEIVSSNYIKDEAGLKITLTDGVFDAKNFKIDADGNVTMVCKVTATSGYIGDSANGFVIGDKAIYSIYSKYESGVDISYYMTSPSAFSGVYYLKETDTTEFCYVGTDGVGTMKIIPTDGTNNVGYSALSTYMAAGKLFSNSAEITGNITATSGYIGNSSSGFVIGSQAIYNVLTSNDNQYYMTNPSNLNSTDAYAGGISTDNYRDYVYVGTDGIGTLRTVYTTDGTNKITAKTYIQNGELHTNAGIIGDGTYAWNIGSGSDNAYLYCGTSSLAGDGGLGSTTNNVYFGTNGLSYSLGTSDSGFDYTTIVKSGQVLTYGDNSGSNSHHRATRLHYNGIEFFYAGASAISGLSSLASSKVASITVNQSGALNITIGNNTGLTGWTPVYDGNSTKYLYFVSGILVNVTTTTPSEDDTWVEL